MLWSVLLRLILPAGLLVAPSDKVVVAPCNEAVAIPSSRTLPVGHGLRTARFTATQFTATCVVPFTDTRTIHGLWPQWPGGEWCTGPAFSTEPLQPIIDALNRVWVSDDGNNTAFWQHEWEKHGCCTNMSLLDYFNTTLDLYANAISASPETDLNFCFVFPDMVPTSLENCNQTADSSFDDSDSAP